MSDQLTMRQLASLDWLTLAECANEIGVTPEVVRQWCLRWRDGKDGGLRYAHTGAKPEAEAARINYRVNADDWRKFKAERLREKDDEAKAVRKWVESPKSYV